MILYSPTNGDVYSVPVNYRPRTCFIMTQLRKPTPAEVIEIRQALRQCLCGRDIAEIDADSVVTGRDFLMKIWQMIIAVPLGIAIIHKTMSPQTLSNIFYEIGLLQAYGKETIIIRTKGTKIPSNLVRTEYIEYNASFESNLNKFLDVFLDLPDHFDTIADQMENNPLLAIDYLRRAYLISGDDSYKQKATSIFDSSCFEGRAKNSVEMLLIKF